MEATSALVCSDTAEPLPSRRGASTPRSMVDQPVATSSSRRDPFGLIGATIAGKYKVTDVVGRGGFGVVYRGMHTGFDEAIAVKCLRIDSEISEEERAKLLTRLQEEGRVMHRLSKLSAGIVQALDVGAMTTERGDWVPYLVMEWLEGQPLAELLSERKGEPMTLDDAVALLEPVARALDVAHGQKVAHRDVKPENLYLTGVGTEQTLKVLDFGIAKVLTDTHFTAAPAATKKAPSAFTPCYGSPEQFNKKRGATGPWTDVFALALIVVEAASGKRALDGDDATQLYIAAADPAVRPTLRERGVNTSDEVDQVLRRALAIDPHDRYQSAGAFWRDLHAAMSGELEVESSRASDVSETGEFITRHAIDLDADDLSKADATELAEAPEAPTSPSASAVQPTASSEPDPPSSTPPQPSSARAQRRGPPPPVERQQSSKPSLTTTADPPASKNWMPVVGLLALAAAAAVYYQLQKLGDDPVSPDLVLPDRSTHARTSAAPQPSVSNSSAPQPSASASSPNPLVVVDAGSDAEALDGSIDGAVDGGTEAPYEPPAGMAYLPALDGNAAVVIDINETTTAQYTECVTAGRCVAADRIVVRQDAVAVMGIDPATTPERLADGWVNRCNAVREAANHPINCVSHGQASDYCHFRHKRLPRAAEWKRITGSAAGRRFPWGDTQPECGTACFDLDGACLATAREVATCPSASRAGDRSPDGVLDLGGNVAEWLADAGERTGTGPAWRLIAGGSFIDGPTLLQGDSSRALPPTTAHVVLGFRCAVDGPTAATDDSGGTGGAGSGAAVDTTP